jgi:hypothetical protein
MNLQKIRAVWTRRIEHKAFERKAAKACGGAGGKDFLDLPPLVASLRLALI